eukprot:scaffold51358_cov34-Prasinocladus_malaysianus.AAC.2
MIYSFILSSWQCHIIWLQRPYCRTSKGKIDTLPHGQVRKHIIDMLNVLEVLADSKALKEWQVAPELAGASPGGHAGREDDYGYATYAGARLAARRKLTRKQSLRASQLQYPALIGTGQPLPSFQPEETAKRLSVAASACRHAEYFAKEQLAGLKSEAGRAPGPATEK